MSALDMRAAALKLAENNFKVFPLPIGRKAAKLPKWNVLATTDRKVIEAWWSSGSNANIAIATGRGLLVLDEDPRHGSDESIQQLQETHGVLPATLTARTPSGGRHRYFRVSSDRKVPNSTSKLGSGLDVRGDGGYVAAPPSNLVANDKQTAGNYTWRTSRQSRTLLNGLSSLRHRSVRLRQPPAPQPQSGYRQ